MSTICVENRHSDKDKHVEEKMQKPCGLDGINPNV